MTKQHVTFKEVFNFGWAKTRQHWWYMICTLLIYAVILSAVERSEGFKLFISLLIALSLLSISLVIAKNEHFNFSTLFDKLRSPRVVLNFLILTGLYVVAATIFFVPLIASIFVMMNNLAHGVALVNLPMRLISILVIAIVLAIPGIIISVRFKLFPYVLLENEHLNFIDIIRSTFNLTRGYFWKIFTLLILLGLLNILGAVSVFGLVITIPISVFALAHFYRHLAGHII